MVKAGMRKRTASLVLVLVFFCGWFAGLGLALPLRAKAEDITFSGLTADGASGTTTTKKLKLITSSNIGELLSNFNIDNLTGEVSIVTTKDNGDGTYEIDITVTKPGYVRVRLDAGTGNTITPASLDVAVHLDGTPTPVNNYNVTFTIDGNAGGSGKLNGTTMAVVFGAPNTAPIYESSAWSANNITVPLAEPSATSYFAGWKAPDGYTYESNAALADAYANHVFVGSLEFVALFKSKTGDQVAPALTAGTVNRSNNLEATVKFSSNEVGEYYYQVVEDNAPDPNIDTSAAGTPCGTREVTITNPTGLNAGAKDIWIYVKDGAGNVGKLKIDIPAAAPVPNLVDITQPSAITGVANGTDKNATALGLPASVGITTTNGGPTSATVTWDVAMCSYDPTMTAAQSFTVNGTVALPLGVNNTGNIPLNVTINVAVNARDTAPAFTNTTTTATVEQGKTATLTVSATGRPAPTFSVISQLPGWITFSPASGEFSFAPGAAQPLGNTVLTVRASNGVAPEDTQDITVTVTAASTPAPAPNTEPTYTQRTLRHEATGITLAGSFTDDAALVVTEMALHAKGSCAACDEIRAAGGWVVLYDISITGSYKGDVELSIPVPAGYNGKAMSVWHCRGNHVEKMMLTASGGYVKGVFSSLSPFAVFATGGAPQTGDNSNLLLWVLCGGLALLGPVLMLRRRRATQS